MNIASCIWLKVYIHKHKKEMDIEKVSERFTILPMLARSCSTTSPMISIVLGMEREESVSIF
jgi:hypothetical protein